MTKEETFRTIIQFCEKIQQFLPENIKVVEKYPVMSLYMRKTDSVECKELQLNFKNIE